MGYYMLLTVIPNDRITNIAHRASKLLKVSPEEVIEIMCNDFMVSFLSGYYGREPLFSAANEYIKELEAELI